MPKVSAAPPLGLWGRGYAAGGEGGGSVKDDRAADFGAGDRRADDRPDRTAAPPSGRGHAVDQGCQASALTSDWLPDA
jgi:hypothetical protein